MNENGVINENPLPPEPNAMLEAEATEEALEEQEVTNSDESFSPEDKIGELELTISQLEATIKELREQSSARERVLEEMSDFSSLFPNVSVDTIPESVWNAVKSGSPLTAAYALYEKRCETERAKIAQINAQNASKAAGRIDTNTAKEYFSPDEVRRMSSAEVHANYSKIKESMKKWL